MRPPLRLALGIAFVVSLSLFPSCTRTDARSDAARDTRKPAASNPPPAAAPEAARWDDSDSDGIPDGVELRSFDDRENFRDWFTAVAEMMSYEESDAWNPEQRDCAGLVRFAWREALRRHDRVWTKRMGGRLVWEPAPPDVRAYSLEDGPLGEKLFRTRPGSFARTDLGDGTFSEFADGRTLKNYNTVFVGRERARARRGDLVFFHQPWSQKYPYHVMIFLGESHGGDEEGDDWVVYHTGASPEEGGEVREVRLSVLERHPDRRWRPVAANKNFLGFYRLKILD